jgi:hypothetical protein
MGKKSFVFHIHFQLQENYEIQEKILKSHENKTL